MPEFLWQLPSGVRGPWFLVYISDLRGNHQKMKSYWGTSPIRAWKVMIETLKSDMYLKPPSERGRVALWLCSSSHLLVISVVLMCCCFSLGMFLWRINGNKGEQPNGPWHELKVNTGLIKLKALYHLEWRSPSSDPPEPYMGFTGPEWNLIFELTYLLFLPPNGCCDKGLHIFLCPHCGLFLLQINICDFIGVWMGNTWTFRHLNLICNRSW